jgi:ATP-dependent Zn protease
VSARALARELSQIPLYKTHPWGQIERRGVDLGNSFQPALSLEERRILNYAYDKACAFIEKRRDAVEQLTDILYENGALSTERIDEILGSRSSIHLVGATGKTFVEFD